MTRDAPRPATAALARLMHLGKPGRHVGLQLDVVRSLGLRSAMRLRAQLGAAAPVHPAARARRYRDLWEGAARDVGATLTPLDGDFLRIERDDRSLVVWQNLVPVDDPVALKLAASKPTAHRLLRARGVAVTEHLEVRWDEVEPALRLLEAGPCVVKPADGTGRGTGVTCGVRTADDLTRAALRASRWSNQLLVERQVDGDEYRVTVLDGEVLGAVRRRPPRVVGDGRRSIGELIATTNRARREADGTLGLWPVRIDLDCILTLARQGLTTASVPGRGDVVAVKTAVNENGPDDNETVVHPPGPLAEAAIAAAGALGVRLAGVEIVTPDAERPLADAGGAVIEVNTTPGFLYHYQVTDPAHATPVASAILERLLRRAA